MRIVADETGLGKSMVARGVIAKTIERLQHDATVDRIDIVYVCSNSDIVQQNLERLDVLDAGGKHHATRLTLLARDSGQLCGEPNTEVGKRVNLISFTPGTSFDMGSTTGRSDERTLLHHILCEALDLSGTVERRAAAVVLRGTSELVNFRRQLMSQELEPDVSIVRPFLRAIKSSGLRTRFLHAVNDLGRRTKDVTAPDVDAYVALRRLAKELDSAISVDYWKSSPYFVNFSDGYQLGTRLRERLTDPDARDELRPLLRSTQHLDRHRVETLSSIDSGNARLRKLMGDTVHRGWWKLLWTPPSLPYVAPGGPFADPEIQGMTKRLVFSSWMAAPTSIAALLSYEARRRLAGSAEDFESHARRLQFRMDGSPPGAMTTPGNKRADNDESARQPSIRNAFNSPFWPFVLATTSVGQEGLDFHWWCHATLHWNTPASPVDFEQREGRVHRFGGHAIRRNLAQRYGERLLEIVSDAAVRCTQSSPWGQPRRMQPPSIAFRRATEADLPLGRSFQADRDGLKSPPCDEAGY